MVSTPGIPDSVSGRNEVISRLLPVSDQNPEELIQEPQKICDEIENQLEQFIEQYYREITPETNFYALMAALSDLLIDIRGRAYELEDLEDVIGAALYPDMDG